MLKTMRSAVVAILHLLLIMGEAKTPPKVITGGVHTAGIGLVASKHKHKHPHKKHKHPHNKHKHTHSHNTGLKPHSMDKALNLFLGKTQTPFPTPPTIMPTAYPTPTIAPTATPIHPPTQIPTLSKKVLSAFELGWMRKTHKSEYQKKWEYRAAHPPTPVPTAWPTFPPSPQPTRAPTTLEEAEFLQQGIPDGVKFDPEDQNAEDELDAFVKGRQPTETPTPIPTPAPTVPTEAPTPVVTGIGAHHFVFTNPPSPATPTVAAVPSWSPTNAPSITPTLSWHMKNRWNEYLEKKREDKEIMRWVRRFVKNPTVEENPCFPNFAHRGTIWNSTIFYNGKTIPVGSYNSKKEAEHAADMRCLSILSAAPTPAPRLPMSKPHGKIVNKLQQIIAETQNTVNTLRNMGATPAPSAPTLLRPTHPPTPLPTFRPTPCYKVAGGDCDRNHVPYNAKKKHKNACHYIAELVRMQCSLLLVIYTEPCYCRLLMHAKPSRKTFRKTIPRT